MTIFFLLEEKADLVGKSKAKDQLNCYLKHAYWPRISSLMIHVSYRYRNTMYIDMYIGI